MVHNKLSMASWHGNESTTIFEKYTMSANWKCWFFVALVIWQRNNMKTTGQHMIDSLEKLGHVSTLYKRKCKLYSTLRTVVIALDNASLNAATRHTCIFTFWQQRHRQNWNAAVLPISESHSELLGTTDSSMWISSEEAANTSSWGWSHSSWAYDCSFNPRLTKGGGKPWEFFPATPKPKRKWQKPSR